MAKITAPTHSPEEQAMLVRIAAGSVLWLIVAPVVAHFTWAGVPAVVVMALAAMAELLVLTAWLVGSTLHDPVKRWELPPNPADAQRGWRGAVGRVRSAAQGTGEFVRHKLLRRPAKA